MKQKNPAKFWNIVSAVMLALLVLCESLLAFSIWRLRMLPTNYFLILVAALVVITGLLCLLFKRSNGKYQKKSGSGRQIVACILSLLLIIGSLAGYYAISKVQTTIDAITSTPTTVTVLLEVYVREDDPAEYINDTAAYTFGLSEFVDDEDNQEMLRELETVLGTSVATERFEDNLLLIDALLSGEVDAIILDSSFVGILEDLDDYTDFTDKARTLMEHAVEKEVVVADSPILSTLPVLKNPSAESFVVYIAGSDTRSSRLVHSRSDVNILAVVNPTTHQILLINTPRDYYVQNPAGRYSMDKLTHCALGGIENSMAALSTLYGQPIHYYARINFSGFETLVDAIGGVTVNSPKSFSTVGGYYFSKGENRLNGAQALAFARERKHLAGGDNDRGQNQMRLIKGIVNELLSGSILTNYSQILASLEGMFTTNMSSTTIGQLVQLQLKDLPEWEILSFAVTGSNSTGKCWAAGNAYAYVMVPHQSKVNLASDLIARMLKGETISEADLTTN